jgi:undecaprenyl-diphosphatase
MEVIKNIILGIVQGIGEFLPISSSAHLILIPYLFNWDESSLAFDIALHFGTLLAVLIIFFKDWWKLFIGAVKKVTKGKDSTENKMFWYLIIATIPGALAGLLLDDVVEGFFRKQIWLIALSLAIMGVLIYLGDRWASKHYKNKEIEFKKISLKQAFVVGCSQALAVIPGFSRSGTTILAGRLMGISKEAITKFTFLLSVPIIAGATILKLPDLEMSVSVITGVLTSFIVGVLSIKFLLKYIKKHDFSIFAFYRVILAIIVYIKLIWF